MMWSKLSRRIDPINRSAKPFCQGEAGAIGFPSPCPVYPCPRKRTSSGRARMSAWVPSNSSPPFDLGSPLSLEGLRDAHQGECRGFLVFSQAFDRPARYRLSARLDTIPLGPSRPQCSKIGAVAFEIFGAHGTVAPFLGRSGERKLRLKV
jgi:hypothetical protein